MGGAEGVAGKALGEDKGSGNPAGQAGAGDATPGNNNGQGKGAAASSALGGTNDLLTGIVNDVVGHDADRDAKGGSGTKKDPVTGKQVPNSGRAGAQGTGADTNVAGGGTGGSARASAGGGISGGGANAGATGGGGGNAGASSVGGLNSQITATSSPAPAASANLKDLQGGTGAGPSGAAGKSSNQKNDVGQSVATQAASSGTLGGSLTWQKLARFAGFGKYNRETGKLSFGNTKATAGGLAGKNHATAPSNAENNYKAPAGASGKWSAAKNAEMPDDLKISPATGAGVPDGVGSAGASKAPGSSVNPAQSASSNATTQYIDSQGHFNPDGVGGAAPVTPNAQAPGGTEMMPSPTTTMKAGVPPKPVDPNNDPFSLASIGDLFNFSGMFATGGTMFAGQSYLTGERGPEPVFARQAGYVVSHSDARKAMSGAAMGGVRGGGGSSAVTNITVNTPDANSFKNSQTQIMGKATSAMNRARR